MVLLVLCAIIVRLADALHKTALLDCMLVWAGSNKKIFAHPKFYLDTNEASAGGLSGGVMNTIVGLGASEFAMLAPQRFIRPVWRPQTPKALSTAPEGGPHRASVSMTWTREKFIVW